MLFFTNTFSGHKEPFKPIYETQVSLYVCGITPYDYAHVGHGRCYVFFDVLYRFLRMQDYNVTYCRNYTDIDDKLLARAEKELGNAQRYPEIAQKYITAYQEDMERLNCLSPQKEPRVTQVIPDIIAFIETLIKKDAAYVAQGDVYFRVRKFPSYGQLSKRNIDDLCAGARVEVNTLKEDPLDFALWKSDSSGTFWQSPWGMGRPGWHIECSVMAAKELGTSIDIHGGGMDLIFPHHENERAQSESCSGKTFVNCWMHNAFVRINEEKMSKSLGNFFTLRDIFEKVDPMVLRFYFLNHHYRSPLDFSFEDLEVAQTTYRRLCQAFVHIVSAKKIDAAHPLIKKMVHFLADDVNTVAVWGTVFENIKVSDEAKAHIKAFLQQVFGLSLEQLPEKEILVTLQMQELLVQREQARAEKDWVRADALRDQLKELGYVVQDKK